MYEGFGERCGAIVLGNEESVVSENLRMFDFVCSRPLLWTVLHVGFEIVQPKFIISGHTVEGICMQRQFL